MCMWTAPYVVCSNDHLTAIRRRERAPSTTSKREAAFLGPMPALASCGRTVPRSYVREVPQKQTLEATWQGRLHL